MKFAYYPGCSLKGSAKKFDIGIKKVFSMLGYELTEIPHWNCCGALEYGNKKEIIRLSRENLNKAKDISREVVAPCPACSKNLKEANENGDFKIYNPLELFTMENLKKLKIKRGLSGQIFTPYYGCVLIRPKETAIPDEYVMENFIEYSGGSIWGEKIKAKCCGGSQFFNNRWATERLSRMILERSKGTIVVFCPLCHMSLTTFSDNEKIVYFTDLILYTTGEAISL